MAYVFVEIKKCDICERQTCNSSPSCHLCATHKCSTNGCNNACVLDFDTSMKYGVQHHPLCFVCEKVASQNNTSTVYTAPISTPISKKAFIQKIATPTVQLRCPPTSQYYPAGIVIRRQFIITPNVFGICPF
jgi:hypothetical protein